MIFTRNGGANREYYEEIFNSLRKHQNYKYDYDDDYDSTYAYIEFSLDEKIFPIAEENFSITPEERGIKLFQHVMENINDKNNPFVAKALDVGRSIIEKINSAESDILEV